MAEQVLRIGVFYDGNYLYHVSNYYAYRHELHSRLSISGLHQFIRDRVSHLEQAPTRCCHIVDAHYFRGRYSTQVIEQKGWLRGERIFEDVLMYNGITTHYWPMMEGNEKSVDVALALEAYELTMLKKFDICVLIAGDGDYTPLVRKLNETGTRVMVLGWDFDFTDERNIRHETRISRALLCEATYPVVMSDLINKGLYGPGSRCSLFVTRQYDAENEIKDDDEIRVNEVEDCRECSDEDLDLSAFADEDLDDTKARSLDSDDGSKNSVDIEGEPVEIVGRICKINTNGYGFIRPDSTDNILEGRDIYFHKQDIENCDFHNLIYNDIVRFQIGTNDMGFIAKHIQLVDNN